MNIDNNEIECNEKEEEILLKEQELKEYEKKLAFREKLLKSRQEKLEEKEAAIDEEILKQREERKSLREERGNIQKECDERAAEVVKEVNARNKELAKQVTELVGVKYENENLLQQLNEKENVIKQLLAELYECKNKLVSIESQKNLANIIDLDAKLEKVDFLENENVRLKNENENLLSANKRLEDELSDKERLQDNIEILKNKLDKNRSHLKYLKRLEEAKGTGEDGSQTIFNEIIEKQKQSDQSETPIGYKNDEEFIKGFLQYCRKAGFVYEENLVRSFICSLRSSKLTILKGYSGTGKSSIPTLLAKYLKSECIVIPVQPNWRTKQDIMGFYNYFTNRFIPTELTQTLLRANVSKDRIFFVVLDEMNLARVEYYFSEFNSKLWLDEEAREIELFEGLSNYDGTVSEYIKNNKIKIPDNVFFIGTINEDDSVSPISDKIFDRAQVIEFMQLPSSETVGDLDKAPQDNREDKYTSFKSFNNIKSKEEREFNIDIIDKVNESTKEKFNKVIGYRSIGQVKEYVKYYKAAGGNIIDAIDMQLVSKFVPKLKYLYSDDQIKSLQELRDEIVILFIEEYKCSEEEAEKLQIIKQIDSIIKELEV